MEMMKMFYQLVMSLMMMFFAIFGMGLMISGEIGLSYVAISYMVLGWFGVSILGRDINVIMGKWF